jgi:hypothetical protein
MVAVLSKMMTMAMAWKLRADNPCKGVERNPETKRKRYLTRAELGRLMRALAEHGVARAMFSCIGPRSVFSYQSGRLRSNLRLS